MKCVQKRYWYTAGQQIEAHVQKKEPPIAINYKHLLTEKTRVYNIFNKTKSDEERASNSPPIDSMTSVHISVLVHMLNERVIKLEQTLYKKIKKLK